MTQKDTMNLSDRLEFIVKKYDLSPEAKKELRSLVVDSYIMGSNDCYNIYFKR